MFATDRDLLCIDPMLFATVTFPPQRLLSGTGSLDAGQLTLDEQDVSFQDIDLRAGHVVVVGGTALEVLARLDKWSASVSMLRAAADGAAVPPPDVKAAAVNVWTFAPQLALAHAELLHELGIRTGSTATVLNPQDLIELECLMALRHILGSAGLFATTTPNGEALRASLQQRIAQARRGLVALIDADGDGRADCVKQMDVVVMVRG